MSLWDLMFDAMFHRAPKPVQYAVLGLLVAVVGMLLWWSYSGGEA